MSTDQSDDRLSSDRPRRTGRPRKAPTEPTSQLLTQHPEPEEVELTFPRMVRHLLIEANEEAGRSEGNLYSINDLAAYAGLARGTLHAWMAAHIGSSLPRNDIYRLAWALAGMGENAFEPVTPGGRWGTRSPNLAGRAKLGIIIGHLLRAAGYSALEGRHNFDTDLVYERIRSNRVEERELNVGFVESWPLFRVTPERTVEGIGVALTQRLAAFLNVKVRWTPLVSWKNYEVTHQIRRQPKMILKGTTSEDSSDSGKAVPIDLLAPRLAVPQRLLGIRYTRGLPGLTAGVNAVVHKDCLGYVMFRKDIPYTKLLESDSFAHRAIQPDWLERLVFESPEGNMGQYASELLLPPQYSAPLHSETVRPGPLWQEELAWLRERSDYSEKSPMPERERMRLRMERLADAETRWWFDGNRKYARGFISGQLLCYDMLEPVVPEFKAMARQLTTLVDLKKLPKIAPLEYAFGVSRYEELFFDLVDGTLATIFNDHEFMRQLYAEYLPELIASGLYHGPADGPFGKPS